MVKTKPEIPDREIRKRRRLEDREKTHHRRLLKLATFSPSSSSPSPLSPSQQQQQHEETHQNSAKSQETSTTVQKSPVTPPSISMRRRRIVMKKRSRSPNSSSHYHSSSPSSTPYYSPSSLSCSSSSTTPSMSISAKINTFDQSVAESLSVSEPNSPELSPLPPFPPRPSPNLLRRTVSDPVPLLPHSSQDNCLTPQRSAMRSVSRNLMGQLPPLPPSPSPPSSKQQSLLRRTISDPVPLPSPDFKENEKGKMIIEQAVEAEKLSGEWIVVKFNCQCGKDNHYLVNTADKKHFKLV